MRVCVFISLFGVLLACANDERMVCRNSENIEDSINAIASDPNQSLFELGELTDFHWTRLDAFGEYSPVERVRERTGLSYRESRGQDIWVREAHALLVFSDEEGVVCFVEVRNGAKHGAAWAFCESVFGDGIAREQARFNVVRGGSVPVVERVAR